MKELDSYINSLRIGGKSNATIRVYTKDLNKFISYFNVASAIDLGNISVVDYQNFYNSQELSPKSKNGLIRSLSAFFSFLETNHYVTKDNAFFNVRFGKGRFIKEPKKIKPILTHDECIALINAAKNIQDRLMLSIMVTTALRRDEISKIKLSDISGCNIKISGKGNKERVTRLDKNVCKILNSYLSKRKIDSEYLFYAKHGKRGVQLSGNSINNRVKHYVQIADIDPAKKGKITAHRIRGSALTEIAREYGLLAAMNVAGHSDIHTTMLYMEDGNSVTADVIGKRENSFENISDAE